MSLYLIIMGVQGAGKGTQAAYIKDTFNIPHVSTGDLFRAMKTREDALAHRVQDIMNSGQLVPDDVTNEVLQDRLEQPDAENGVILDGYPRNTAQAEWLASYLESKGKALSAVLLLELDLYTAFKRAYGRVKSPSTGETYNIYFHEGIEYTLEKDPNGHFAPRVKAVHTDSGEALSRRGDDEAASVVKRIDTFRETTAPLIDYYSEHGRLIRIDAAQPIKTVSAHIKAVLDEIAT